jgi:hypothetical protein
MEIDATLVLVTYSHGVPSFLFNAACTLRQLKLGTKKNSHTLRPLMNENKSRPLNFPHKEIQECME